MNTYMFGHHLACPVNLCRHYEFVSEYVLNTGIWRYPRSRGPHGRPLGVNGHPSEINGATGLLGHSLDDIIHHRRENRSQLLVLGDTQVPVDPKGLT